MSKANAATIPTFDPLERLAELRRQAEEGEAGRDPLSLARLAELHGHASEARQHQQPVGPVVSRAVRGAAPVVEPECERESDHGGAVAPGLFDAEDGVGLPPGNHDRQGVAEAPPPVEAVAGAIEQPGGVGTVEITPFVQRVREACGELRPRYWFLINTLEGHEGCAEAWAERGEGEIVLRRWEWLKGAYRRVLDPDAAEADVALARLLGARGDEFATWIECEPSELVDWLEKCA